MLSASNADRPMAQRGGFTVVELLVAVASFFTSLSRTISNVVSLEPWQLAARRQADDGSWYSQQKPFSLNVYSAFYDDRPSLGVERPHVIVITVPRGRVTLCLLWFNSRGLADNDTIVVPAKAMRVDQSYTVELISCPLSTVNVTEVPREVSLAWGRQSDQR